MDIRTELRRIGKNMADAYLPNVGMPLKVYSGSLGDPYGYTHRDSDVDMEVWVTDPKYIKPENEPVVNWAPNEWKWKTRTHWNNPPTDIDVVSNIEGGHSASVAFMFVDGEKIPIYMQHLKEGLEKSDISDYNSPMDFALRHFSETEPIEDNLGIYDTIKTEAARVFSEKRKDYAKRMLDKGRLRFLFYKLEDDIKIIENGDPIDVTQYNGKAIEAVNLLTHGMCCTRNIPRSYYSIEGRRKNNLWRALDINEEQVNRTMVSSDNHMIEKEKAELSFETLKELTKKFYEDARREFGDFKLETISFLR